jgi:phage-related protein
VARQIVVEIVGDASKFNAATKGAVKDAEGMGGKLKNVTKGAAIGIGFGAIGLLTTGIGLLTDKLGESAQAFRDDQASKALLDQAIKNNVKSYAGASEAAEKYAEAQGRLGFADDDVRASLGQLVGVTHDMTEAQKLNSLAQDLARAKGIDLATASDIITKAYQGNGKALKALGIDTQGAETSTELLAAVMQNATGAAETFATTSEGKVAASQVKVGEAMEKVGSVLDQVTQAVLPIFAEGLTGVMGILGQLAAAFGPVIQMVVAKLMPVFQRLLPLAQKIFGGIVAVVTALQPVFEVVFSALGLILSAWITAIEVGFTIISTAVDILGGVFKGFGDIVGTVFGAISGIVRGAINGVIGIVNGVIDAINSIQVHIHVGPVNLDWNGLNIGKIPRMHTGGVVSGPAGSDQLRMLQAGETVLPAGQGAGTTIIVNIESFIGSDRDIDRFTDRVAFRLRALGPTG